MDASKSWPSVPVDVPVVAVLLAGVALALPVLSVDAMIYIRARSPDRDGALPLKKLRAGQACARGIPMSRGR